MTTTTALFRKLALSLPGAIESAHMGHPDFRVPGADGKLRIFATLSGQETARGVLKLTLEQQTAFCTELPAVFEPVKGRWGRMGMTYVRLETVAEETLLGALATAHRNVTSKIESATPERAAAARGPASRTSKRVGFREGQTRKA